MITKFNETAHRNVVTEKNIQGYFLEVIKNLLKLSSFEQAQVYSKKFHLKTDRKVEYVEKFHKLLQITNCNKHGITLNAQDSTGNLISINYEPIDFEEEVKNKLQTKHYFQNLLNFIYISGFFVGLGLQEGLNTQVYELIKDEIEFISIFGDEQVRYYLDTESNLGKITKDLNTADISTISDLELGDLVLVDGKYYNQEDVAKAITSLSVSAIQKEDLEPNVTNKLPQTKRKVHLGKRKTLTPNDDNSSVEVK